MGNKQGEMNVIKNLLQALGGWLAQPESHSYAPVHGATPGWATTSPKRSLTTIEARAPDLR